MGNGFTLDHPLNLRLASEGASEGDEPLTRRENDGMEGTGSQPKGIKREKKERSLEEGQAGRPTGQW